MARQALRCRVAPGPEGVADHSERTMISVSPRAGISNMVGDSGYFQISPHFSGGLSASMGAGDYFSFQVGYTYSQYGVSMASSNPWVIQAQQQAAYLGQGTFQDLNMNQNVFDAGVKIHLLGPDSRIRPYIGGGGAYARSYINFSSQILAADESPITRAARSRRITRSITSWATSRAVLTSKSPRISPWARTSATTRCSLTPRAAL